MSDTSSIIGKVGAEGCIEWEEGHQGSGEGSGNPTWESSFPGRGDRTELLLEVGEMKRPRVVRPWVKVPMGQSQSYGPQRVGQPEELMSHLGSQGPMDMSFTIGYLPLRPTSATQDSPKAKAGRYSHRLLLSRYKVYSRKTKPVSFYTDITYLAKLWGCEGKTRV